MTGFMGFSWATTCFWLPGLCDTSLALFWLCSFSGQISLTSEGLLSLAKESRQRNTGELDSPLISQHQEAVPWGRWAQPFFFFTKLRSVAGVAADSLGETKFQYSEINGKIFSMTYTLTFSVRLKASASIPCAGMDCKNDQFMNNSNTTLCLS